MRANKAARSLSDDQVREIRRSPLTAYAIGQKMGVHEHVVQSVRARAAYRDVPEEMDQAVVLSDRFIRGDYSPRLTASR